MANFLSEASTQRYIVVIDDDPLVASLIEAAIAITCVGFQSIPAFEAKYLGLRPMAIFLDLHLSAHETSLTYLPTLKQKFPDIPIIVITADSNPQILGDAFGAGADDFIRKPFVAEELQARLLARAIDCRRKSERYILKMGDLRLHARDCTLSGPKTKVTITPKECKLLAVLIEHQGQILTRSQCFHFVWGRTRVSTNSLDKLVQRGRELLTEVGSSLAINNKYGKGFALLKASDSKAA